MEAQIALALDLGPDPEPEKGRPVQAARAEWKLGESDRLPDVRDGLTRVERVVLFCLHEAQAERGDRMVPTAMLYGRVCERINLSVDEFQSVLQRMIGVR